MNETPFCRGTIEYADGRIEKCEFKDGNRVE
jgi:hypothetical protein